MTVLVDKLKPARVVRVHGVNRVELDIDLGFGVRVVRTFTIEGINHDTVPRELLKFAVHALVVLIGGKKVMVQPESELPDARLASVYLCERLHGHPVGYVADIPGLPQPILDVAMFFGWLSERSFEIRLVREVVNGRRRVAEES